MNASLCQCTGALSPLKPELKKTHVDDRCAAQIDSQKVYDIDISSAPLSSDGLERRSSGKAPRPHGWIYSQTPSMGPGRPIPLHLGPTKTATHLARSCSVRIGIVRFEKSLVANLSAKRQLSVTKLPCKRIFSLANWDFFYSQMAGWRPIFRALRYMCTRSKYQHHMKNDDTESKDRSKQFAAKETLDNCKPVQCCEELIFVQKKKKKKNASGPFLT